MIDDKTLVEKLLTAYQLQQTENQLVCDKAAARIAALSAEVDQLKLEKAGVDDLLEQQRDLALEYLNDCNKAVEWIKVQATEIDQLRIALDKSIESGKHLK